MRVLAIGVHPDDIEFGMGGSLAKHISMKHDVSIIILTDGSRDDNGNYIKSDERRQESISALKILGYQMSLKDAYTRFHQGFYDEDVKKLVEYCKSHIGK